MGVFNEALRIRRLATGSDVLAGSIARIRMLGSEAPIEWVQDPAGLHIKLPAEKPCEHAFAFAIEHDQPLQA